MTNDEQINLVILGHVDHGKSTLIGRLLFETESLSPSTVEAIKKASSNENQIDFSLVMDHLTEERSKKMTIDVSEIPFNIDGRRYAIIDSPGHLEFLKNMATGASKADAAVLLIDVAEGIKEQTQRHAYLLKLFGITQVIVAVNKMDIVGYSEKKFIEAKNEVLKYLNSISVSPMAVVPISASLGENILQNNSMDWLVGDPLLSLINKFMPLSSRGEKLRLPVQGHINIDNEEVYLARVDAGELQNNKYFLAPANKEISITKILSYDGKSLNNIESAKKGSCIGFTADQKLSRSDIVIEKDSEKIVNNLSTSIFWIDNESKAQVGDKFNFKLSTQNTECQLSKINFKINPENLERIKNPADVGITEIGEVELTLNSPVMVDSFNFYPKTSRFVLERDGLPVAGGIIVTSQ